MIRPTRLTFFGSSFFSSGFGVGNLKLLWAFDQCQLPTCSQADVPPPKFLNACVKLKRFSNHNSLLFPRRNLISVYPVSGKVFPQRMAVEAVICHNSSQIWVSL